nr:LytTR family DNA-binding domain-containing protein [Pedobacter sp. ASV19]
MNLRVYIIDDEQHAIDYTEKFILRTPGLQYLGGNTDPVDAFQKIKDGIIVADIVIVDLEMEDLPGDKLAPLIQPYADIIFSTAHKDFAADAFRLNPIDYLVKPYSYDRFLMAIEKAKVRRSGVKASILPYQEPPYFLIQTEGMKTFTMIYHSEIVCVESALNYISIHMDHQTLLAYYTTKEMEEKFQGRDFLRIHKSFIINLSRIARIVGNTVTMSNGIEILIGRKYKPDFIERTKAIVFKSKRGNG